MAHHYSRRAGYEDVRPPVMRFVDEDRIREAEEDAQHSVEQRVAAWQKVLAPVRPDHEHEARGVRYAVYTGAEAREMRRRSGVARRAREGGR